MQCLLSTYYIKYNVFCKIYNTLQPFPLRAPLLYIYSLAPLHTCTLAPLHPCTLAPLHTCTLEAWEPCTLAHLHPCSLAPWRILQARPHRQGRGDDTQGGGQSRVC